MARRTSQVTALKSLLPHLDLTWEMLRAGDLLLRWDDPDFDVVVILDVGLKEYKVLQSFKDGRHRLDKWIKGNLKNEHRQVVDAGYRVYRP